jgi:hypothetical protein
MSTSRFFIFVWSTTVFIPCWKNVNVGVVGDESTLLEVPASETGKSTIQFIRRMLNLFI